MSVTSELCHKLYKGFAKVLYAGSTGWGGALVGHLSVDVSLVLLLLLDLESVNNDFAICGDYLFRACTS